MKSFTGKASSGDKSTDENRLEFKRFKNILDMILRAVDSSVQKHLPTNQISIDEKTIGFAIQNYFSLCKTADNKKFINNMQIKSSN